MALGSGDRTKVKFEASEVFWGTQECRSYQATPDIAGSLDSLYEEINGMDQDVAEQRHYWWLDLDGVGTDPAIAGATAIPVVIATGDSAATIAAAIQAAVSANQYFNSEVIDTDQVRVQNKYIGAITAEGGNSTFVKTAELTGNGGNLGGTSGGITLETAVEVFTVLLDQTGNIPRDAIQTSVSASVSMSLAELTKERKELLIGSAHGNNYTPGGGTSLQGYGRSKLYESVLSYSGPLYLRPIRNKASGDRSEDVVLWLTAPEIGSLNFSGTDPQVAEITFNAYLDSTKPEEIDLFAIGDWTQDL
jgi:hypothetical protein